VRILLLALILTTAGCAARREVGLPVVYGSSLRVDGRPEVAGAQPAAAEDEALAYASWWREVPDDFGAGATPARPTIHERLAERREAEARRAAASRPSPAPQPTLAVPLRKARREARPEGKCAGKDTAQLARDHYLDYPTHIQAERLTFACPRSYTGRVHLTGDHVDRSRPERVQVQGHARLVLGELTLEGERITWRVQPEGKLDIQILARGDVHLVSEVRGNVSRETGIRSLVITNDQVIPLR
jgi:hypothetical protein